MRKNSDNNYIFEKSFGILTPFNIHPLQWQKAIRNEWDRKFKLNKKLILKDLQIESIQQTSDTNQTKK